MAEIICVHADSLHLVFFSQFSFCFIPFAVDCVFCWFRFRLLFVWFPLFARKFLRIPLAARNHLYRSRWIVRCTYYTLYGNENLAIRPIVIRAIIYLFVESHSVYPSSAVHYSMFIHTMHWFWKWLLNENPKNSTMFAWNFYVFFIECAPCVCVEMWFPLIEHTHRSVDARLITKSNMKGTR